MTSESPAGAARPQAPAAPAGGLAARLRGLSPRAEFAVVLLLGAAGAGLVYLALRQGWAQVRTPVPAPLPTSVVTVTGQSLVPLAGALDIAALASLAAVLATRRTARRVTGVLVALLGAGIAATAASGVSGPAALAAAAQGLGPSTGAGAGTAPGSVTDGSGSGGTAVPGVGGFHAHAVLTAATWQAAAIIGALALIAAGILVTWRATRLPVMSSRYDSPAGTATPAGPGARASGGVPARAGGQTAKPDEDTDAGRSDSATMWESLSRGEDPTSARRP